MKIVIVNHRYAPFVGGSELWVQAVAEHRASTGDRVTVLTTNAFELEYLWDARARKVMAPQRELLGGVDVVRLPVRHHPGSATLFHGLRRGSIELGRWRVFGPVVERMAQLRPWIPGFADTTNKLEGVDLVHATNLGIESLALSARAYARSRRAPFVITPFLHIGDHRQSVAWRHATLPHQRALVTSADAVIAMTHIERAALEAVGVKRSRIVVTGAGVDESGVTGGCAQRFRDAIGVSSRFVGCIGAKAADKGTPDVVRAVAALRRAGADVRALLVGPSLASFTKWLASQPAEVRDAVIDLGVVDDETKRDVLAAIDVLALPSRTESFGIVYLEAWLNHKPVIAADVGAVAEIVRHGETGLLVEFGNVAALAAAIQTLLTDDALSNALGNAGAELVREQFLWPAVLERVDRAYDIALAGLKQ